MREVMQIHTVPRYETLVAWAAEFGNAEAAKLLQETLERDYAADRLLSQLWERSLRRSR